MVKFLIFLILIFNLNVEANLFRKVNTSSELFSVLKNIENGESVVLGSGVYVGNFSLDKSVSLISYDGAVLTSAGFGTILTIESSNVYISGISFYNSGKDMSVSDSCLFITGNNVHVIDNFFSECGFSIWSNESSCNYFFNNIFIGGADNILSDRGNVIHIYKGSNSVISDNFLVNGRDGIYITNSNEVSINRNIFTNVRFGIHYMFSNKCNVVSNIVVDSMIGIAVMYSKYVDLINNFSYKNVTHGLFFRDVLYSRILRNKSLYNRDGILLGDSYFNDIINNDIIKNVIGIKVYSGSDDNLVYDNNFISNNLQIQFLDNRKLVWNSLHIGNFWSHYVGWDVDFNGIGDKIFYVTNISDWLVSVYPILKIMFNSPALILLQKIENQFPTFRKFSIIDNYPLMRPVIW